MSLVVNPFFFLICSFSFGGWKWNGRRVEFKKMMTAKILLKGLLELTMVAGNREINLPESILIPNVTTELVIGQE